LKLVETVYKIKEDEIYLFIEVKMKSEENYLNQMITLLFRLFMRKNVGSILALTHSYQDKIL
jgi:hypothetical protein